MSKTKRLTFNIPEDTHHKLKILAAITKHTMTDILIDCIERRYEEQEKAKK